MVESRPLYLLLCLMRAPFRLRRRYHADPLLKYAAIVVYTHMPIAYQAVASSPCFASSGHLLDYGDGSETMYIFIPFLSMYLLIYGIRKCEY